MKRTTMSAAGGSTRDAGAAIATLLVVAAARPVVRTPLTRVPENAINIAVGAMIVSFGTFWTLEAIGGPAVWPGGDWSLLELVAFYGAGGMLLASVPRQQPRGGHDDSAASIIPFAG